MQGRRSRWGPETSVGNSATSHPHHKQEKMLRIPSPGQLCNPTPRLDSASRATGHRRRETQSDAGTPGRPRRRRPWGAECHGDDALSAGPVFGRPQGPRLPRAAAGPRSPHVAAVIVLAPYPSAPPPQPPTPFPGPPDRGAAEGSHAHARTRARTSRRGRGELRAQR